MQRKASSKRRPLLGRLSRVEIRLRRDEYDEVVLAAEAARQTVSEYIREAVRRHVRFTRPATPKRGRGGAVGAEELMRMQGMRAGSGVDPDAGDLFHDGESVESVEVSELWRDVLEELRARVATAGFQVYLAELTAAVDPGSAPPRVVLQAASGYARDYVVRYFSGLIQETVWKRWPDVTVVYGVKE